MKHLVGSLEDQPLSGPMIQSVLDHSQLLICYGFHASLLGYVLSQQSVEVLVATALPAAIRVSKVGLDVQGLINALVVPKLFAVVHSQGLHA